MHKNIFQQVVPELFQKLFRVVQYCLPAQRINHFTLLVHHVVIIKQGFTDFKVVGFHPFLGPLYGRGNHPVFNWLAIAHAQLRQKPLEAVRPEQTEEIVFKRQEKPGRTGVALTPGTPAQLIVNAARLVAFCAQNMQPAKREGFLVQLDVSAAARHVCGNGHLAPLARLGHNCGLLFVVLGIQHIVGNPHFIERGRNQL